MPSFITQKKIYHFVKTPKKKKKKLSQTVNNNLEFIMASIYCCTSAGQTSISVWPISSHWSSTSWLGTRARLPSCGSTPPSSGSRRTRSSPSSRPSTTGGSRGRGQRSSAVALGVLLGTFITVMVLLSRTVSASSTWVPAKLFLELRGIGSRARRFRSHRRPESFLNGCTHLFGSKTWT
jgi:hypothetical protein